MEFVNRSEKRGCYAKRYPGAMYGVSTIEFVVSLVFFVPVFLTVPMIGKYMDIKQKNLESSRYAAWERSVWADPQGPWNDDENSKTNAKIRDEIDQHFFGNIQQGMADHRISENPMWVNHKGEKLIKTTTVQGAGNNSNNHRAEVTIGIGESPIKNLFVDQLAYKGIPYIGAASSKLTKGVNSTLGSFISDCKDIPGVDLDKGMNLGSKTYATVSVTSVAENYTTGTGDLNFNTKAALLSDAWTAPTEDKYRERVGKLVIDEAVKCIASPARLVSYFPVYKEGSAAKDISGSASSQVILDEYKQKK